MIQPSAALPLKSWEGRGAELTDNAWLGEKTFSLAAVGDQGIPKDICGQGPIIHLVRASDILSFGIDQ